MCGIIFIKRDVAANVKKGFRYERPRWLADIVPTLCYVTGNPVPADAEGGPIYQILENPNLV